MGPHEIPIEIPAGSFRRIASHPGDVRVGIQDLLAHGSESLQREFKSYLKSLPNAAIKEVLAEKQFQFFHSSSENQERDARIWCARAHLTFQIRQARLRHLRSHDGPFPVPPYSETQLTDLSFDADYLADLDQFGRGLSEFTYGGLSALILSTTGAANSTYWLALALRGLGAADATKIRLDPYLWGPQDDFPMMMYKMDVYGQPLDWDRIARLGKMEHGRWYRDWDITPGEFTDYLWEPRDGQIHLQIEEVPPITGTALSNGRYLHAIYDPREGAMVHFDGAIRIMTRVELTMRHDMHLRDTGKMGIRAKVFRVDAPVERDQFGTIAKTHFVWNQDVARYFDTDLVDGAAEPEI